jgi:hypothetical protein
VAETESGARNRKNPRVSRPNRENWEFDRTYWWHIEESNDATIGNHIDTMLASATTRGISRRLPMGCEFASHASFTLKESNKSLACRKPAPATRRHNFQETPSWA